MIGEPTLTQCLRRYWDLADAQVTVHNGGMGSQTWFVDSADRRWVAKAVAPDDGDPLAGGMAVAHCSMTSPPPSCTWADPLRHL